ncbi:MAG: Spx/MgsR family RNA polymerase-binding regulatory protein [Opitutaceae bacterium]
MLKVYTYAKCSTCRKATNWLKAARIAFEELPIREAPPPPDELRTMLAAHRGEMKRILNTSSQDYRDLKLPEKLPTLGDDQVFALLGRNGNLVKRPFALGLGVALVGFDEARWAEAFARRR